MEKIMSHLLIVFVMLFGYSESDKRIGESCRYDSMCEQWSGFTKGKICKDGICQCNPLIELRYSEDLEPRCDNFIHSFSIWDEDCTPTSCDENFECVKQKPDYDLPFGKKEDRMVCRCKQGYLRQSKKCIEANHQEVLQRCYVPKAGPIYSCDINEFSYCKNRKCICFDTYFANKTSGKCEPMENYIRAFNISEYRVKPEEYCTKSSQCITGLECKDYKCSCPYPCTYKREEEICDCGKVEKPPKPGPVGPIMLGFFIGFFIVLFWAYTIRNTIEKHDKKRTAQFSTLATSPRDIPSHNSYPLSPVRPSATNETAGPPAGLVMDGRQSPVAPSVVSNDLPPYKPGSSSPFGPPPPSPKASLYGINPPEAPPSYSLNPPEPPPPYTESAPPYSINPPTFGGSAPPMPYSSNSAGGSAPPMPYPSNPADPTSALPYPASPSAALYASPYSSSPSSVPYSPNPSVQPPAYPASPYGATSTTLPENTAASPPYNPSYP